MRSTTLSAHNSPRSREKDDDWSRDRRHVSSTSQICPREIISRSSTWKSEEMSLSWDEYADSGRMKNSTNFKKIFKKTLGTRVKSPSSDILYIHSDSVPSFPHSLVLRWRAGEQVEIENDDDDRVERARDLGSCCWQRIWDEIFQKNKKKYNW